MAQVSSTRRVATVNSAGEKSERLVSLDAFRGAVMALMVLVNTAGGFRRDLWPAASCGLERLDDHRCRVSVLCMDCRSEFVLVPE